MPRKLRNSDRAPAPGLYVHCGRCGRRLGAGYPTHDAGPTLRMRFVCHQRCSRDGKRTNYVVTRKRLEDTIQRLHDEGRTEVVLGVDL
jgi:hypothetical protein